MFFWLARLFGWGHPNQSQVDEISKEDEIFNLLLKHGPLDETQISIETLLPLEQVRQGIATLSKEQTITLRPDPGVDYEGRESDIPWGLPISRRLRFQS